MSEGDYGVEVIGPFQPECKLAVRGYRVPHLSAIEKRDGRIILSLDERFLIELSRDELNRFLPFLANAMAVAAGYCCHGEGATKFNRYKVQISDINSDDIGGDEILE